MLFSMDSIGVRVHEAAGESEYCTDSNVREIPEPRAGGDRALLATHRAALEFRGELARAADSADSHCSGPQWRKHRPHDAMGTDSVQW